MQAYARFGRASDQVPAARAFVRDTLFRWGETSTLDDTLLVASELFTNAVLHGAGVIDVYVTLNPATLRIAVVDEGQWAPAPAPTPDPDTMPSGRGLRIVQAIASDWGNNFDPVGRTRVWAELPRA
jgi:anti-sigma regulatory factor (Ser/Thr protein kinase)